jgi:general secretion pathway protein D
MKSSVNLRGLLALFLFISMLSPATALAIGDGNKHFRAGMKHEVAEEWDLAVEEFVLAVTDNPKNPEYRLHLQRALFQASQMFMKKGTAAAAEKDYQGAYIAFRKAYGYDPVNELAKSEMARMVRLQEELQKGENPDPKTQTGKNVKLVPTAYTPTTPKDTPVPQKFEKLRDVPFPGGVDLQYIVKELAKDLDLNVLFDAESRLETRKIRIELRNVTAAKALDYIFLQENLFFQRVGPRTILVANGNRRTNFQQLVLRTFYLANAAPKDVKAVISSAIPPQPGRSQTIVLEDASTNSITVRDTEENVRLIGRLINSLDKDRAEVVMDVAIYEVNKNDLLQFGNQIGSIGPKGTLNNLGGVGLQTLHAGATQPITSNLPFTGTDILSIAFGLPISQISALQQKSNTKLIASTQIHAFNNEDSSARIGQRVPVRTATFAPVGGVNNNNNFVGDVINYEQVGLTLKFKPIVFPNQDVQVTMEIESKDVAGAQTETPTFTERTIKGTARVQNNKTLLLASVAQGVQAEGRQGLPLLGLIPILGRLFTAPTRDNRQIDIVIAITPRVIRAPAILPEDEAERPTGALGTPTNSSLEAMIIEEDREEMLAAARRLPTTAQVQLPDQPADSPTYVRTDAGRQPAAPKTDPNATAAVTTPANDIPGLRPIDSSVKTLDITKTTDTSKATVKPEPTVNDTAAPGENKPVAQLKFGSEIPEMKAGQKTKLAVMVDSSQLFRSAVIGLKFDEKRVAVRSVSFGDMFGNGLANTAATPFLNQGGKMFVSLSLPQGTVSATSGVLAYIEVEALADGKPDITVEKDVVNFLAADGKNFAVKF